MKKKALDVHYRKAIRELIVSKSAIEVNRLILKYRPLYDDYSLAFPELKDNLKIANQSIDIDLKILHPCQPLVTYQNLRSVQLTTHNRSKV